MRRASSLGSGVSVGASGSVSLFSASALLLVVGLSDSGKITITIDSCKVLMIYDTITIVKSYATSL